MSCSRRQFIQLSSGIALSSVVLPRTALAASEAQNVLPIPPLIESRRGQPVFLTLQSAHWAFNGGSKAACLGFNGLYLGPTVKVMQGDDIKLIYSNRLNESVSMQVSGLQTPGALSGGAARQISPGVDWSPILPIRQPAATCWYHANTPQHMASQIYKGLAGMWIVEDEKSKNLPIPKHYGVDDIPLIIQDKRFDNFGTPIYESAEKGFLGDTLVINGTQKPYLNVSRGWIRLRLLNASNARRYLLQLSNQRPFTLIASDQGFLPSPIVMQQLSLAPGERKEVLIDLTDGHTVSVTAGTAATLIERIRGIFQPSSILTSTLIVELRPTGLLPLVTDAIPQQLVNELPQGFSANSRTFRLDEASPGINGNSWNINRIDTTVQQGSFERWIIEAEQPQSFSIQGAMFLIKSVNGAPAMPDDRGWKDTVWVDGRVELLVSFPQSSSQHFPFVYGSQNLALRDQGIAGQLLVRQKESLSN